ncbi:MAG: nucleotide sugar dehydrogenase [Bacteroidota bacterium]
MNTSLAHKTRNESNTFLAYRRDPLIDSLVKKEASMAVVGLGYVGLPLAIHMASKFKVIGYDINEDKVNKLLQKIDPCEELSTEDFEGKDISFSYKEKVLQAARFYVVAVPTPIDGHKKPNLQPLKKATALVARYLKKGDCVVFESTVYPGCTEEVCVPILERISRLKLNDDFAVGYSPERINPGDKEHTFTTIKKTVSASNESALELVASVYGEVVEAGIHRAPSLKVAEASKIVENTQRDVNIGLMNQLAKIFSALDINTREVLEAAGTKWNFHNYYPGLVGGHCIGVDPYYLIHKAKSKNVSPRMLEQVRAVNESMVDHIVSKIASRIWLRRMCDETFSVLVKGITFKENVNDIRNSKAAELCLTLKKKGFDVVVEDYMADEQEVKQVYDLDLVTGTTRKFDVIVLAVDHDDYQHLAHYDHLKNGYANTLIFDVKGDKKGRIPSEVYMSL